MEATAETQITDLLTDYSSGIQQQGPEVTIELADLLGSEVVVRAGDCDSNTAFFDSISLVSITDPDSDVENLEGY